MATNIIREALAGYRQPSRKTRGIDDLLFFHPMEGGPSCRQAGTAMTV
jgi:hypothetical protein